MEESYQNWGSRLKDHFTQWTKDQPIAVEELMVLDQFLYGVPEDLRVWLKERRPGSLQQAMKLADDYALARRGGRPTQQRSSGRGTPPITQSVVEALGELVEDRAGWAGGPIAVSRWKIGRPRPLSPSCPHWEGWNAARLTREEKSGASSAAPSDTLR